VDNFAALRYAYIWPWCASRCGISATTCARAGDACGS